MSSGTNTIHTSMAQATSTGTPVASQQSQQAQAQQGQQQIHLQQSTTTTAIHAGNQQQVQAAAQQQHHHAATPTNPMQQLQVIQQPLQNQYLQQLYSTQQGQILMNGNLLHHPGINPQIQVIAANGKTFQTNQLGHPLLNTSYTIPTSSANTQPSYIIGQLSNGQVGLIQQTHQQPGKPGEMPKVLSPQIGTQLPQGLWTSPHTLFQSNPIFIRGTQPDQMFIQQQQPLHTNTSSHQHFSMQPITAQTGQIPSTSIATAAPANIQAQQQQQNVQQAGGQQQQQQGQQIAPQPIQPQPTNVVSIKAPATLQPKPLQIQPQPNQAGQQQQQQSLQQQQQQTLQQQIQQVAMAHSQHQLQIIPQPPTSSQGVLSQQQITGLTPGTITMQTSAGPQQIQTQQTPRQLTILPQQHQAQAIQPQVSIVQQTQQQQQQQAGQQPIRPNFTIVTQNNAASVTMSQVAGPGGAASGATPPGQQQQQRPKVKKVVSKGAPNATTPTNPQANKAVFPRPVQPATSVTPIASQQYLNNGTLTFMHPQAKQATLMSQNAGATLTKVQMSSGPQQQNQQMMQPLKTINISALHSNLPDATLTPLMPQQASVAASVANQVSQPIQVYSTTTTQLPSPVVSITPAPPPPQQQAPQPTTPSKKDDSNADSAATENKNDTEKENAKTNGEESEETSVKQNKPPKAMVKPQVLTHVIEGFVIQEASEPFPMPRNNGDMDEPPKKKAALSIGAEMGKCEMCGKVDLKAKFKKNKRFCSSTCAKSMKSANQQQQQNQQQQTHVNHLTNGATTNGDLKSKKNKKWADGDAELTDETCSSVGDASILSPNDDQPDEEPKVNPVKWSVSEVVEFVKSLPGCCEYAEDFAVQEIDGQALLLLKEDHLMSAIGMKLGPALKLCAKIEGIRSASSGGAANGDANANKA